jgi:ribose transport system substrate-binding protein
LMHPDKTDRTARRLLFLLLVAGVIASGLLLAACGSSSSSSTESSSSEATEKSETTESEAPAGGSAETTAYVEGVPTLKELYETSNEEPPSTGPAAAKGKSVAFISCSQASPGCSEAAAAFSEAGKVVGWNVRVYDGKFNENNGYATAFHAAIASNPDAIVSAGISCSEVKTLLEEVKAADIPVIETNAEECAGAELYAAPAMFNKKFAGAREYYEAFGENQAAYMVDMTEGKAKVILPEYLGEIGTALTGGIKNVVEKCSECEIVESIPFEVKDLGPGLALEQRFKTALVKYSEANAVIIPFDSAAGYGGLAKAVVDSGSEILSVGAEGSAEANALMEEEKGIDAEAGASDNTWIGWSWVDQLNRYFNGQPPVPQGIGLAVITPEHNLPPKGKSYQAEVDFKKAYEEIWAGEKE